MKITLEGLTKRYGGNLAVYGFSAELKDGHLISLLGPSGCGKSTILFMLAGIVPPTAGTIRFDNQDVTGVPAEKRNVGLVFQNYSLYPHMTVLQNICFPMEIKKIPKPRRLERALELAKLVHIENFLKRRPDELSGGQQQRVAIARALAKDPPVLLLDEPLSNLDARLRLEMREEIKRIQRETGITVVFVTHDQEEALSISDEILLMKEGVPMQYDAPQVLYDQPANWFTAGFLGSPPINRLEGSLAGKKFVLAGSGAECRLPFFMTAPEGQPVILAIRPESVFLSEPEQAAFMGTVLEVYTMGKEELAAIRFGAAVLRTYLPASLGLKPGEVIPIGLKDKGVFLFAAESGGRL
ncbi:MAG: ABC transporter ATP-binding protein [Treponema sp.]|jgi:multiple sugar transport system ATP-binding protein|nr:ABC transporter ATP-binding protein [Treponema sp.]